jgi:hypothetical protein
MKRQAISLISLAVVLLSISPVYATPTPTATPTPSSNASWGSSPQSFPVNHQADMQWRAASFIKPAPLPLIVAASSPAAAATPATVQSYTPTLPNQAVYTWFTLFSCTGGSAPAVITITGMDSTQPIVIEETAPFVVWLPWYGEPGTPGLPVSYSVTGGSGATACTATASYYIM